MKVKIGITGCTGSLGRIILKKKGYKFVCFKGDIRKKKDVQNWLSENDLEAIIHLAAIVPIRTVNANKKKALDVNFNGTKNLVDEILNYNIKWFFFSSTSHVYGSSTKKISEKKKTKPISYYGKTKLLSENYIKSKLKNKIGFCIGRIFSTSNISQKKNYLVPDLLRKIRLSKTKIKLTNLNHFRDFISMNEIADIILKFYKINFNGTINIGRGKGILLKNIALQIAKKYKKKIEFIDNNKSTFLVADNKKLKKYINLKTKTNLKKLIF